MINIRQIKLLYNIVLFVVYMQSHHLTPFPSPLPVFDSLFFMVHLSLLYFWCFLCFKRDFLFVAYPLYKQNSPPTTSFSTSNLQQTNKKWYLFIWNESVSCLLYYWCFCCVLDVGEVINLLLLAFLTLWNVSLYLSY